MSKSQYVFVTSKSKMQVIDTAKSVAELQKRIPKKKTPYPEDAVVLRVDKDRILHYLETEEYENATLIDNALMAAVVAGVDFDTAVSRLTEKGILSVVDVPERNRRKRRHEHSNRSVKERLSLADKDQST